MHTVTVSATRRQTLTPRRASPLVRVVTWELRRALASRLFWVQALCFFVLVVFTLWLGREQRVIFPSPTPVIVFGTSAWGLMLFLRNGLGLLGLLLPFVNADGVPRDLHRRTHELLMTTALPTWAYVWGRYLAGLIMGLGLALLLFISLLGMGGLLHLTDATYPLPQPATVFLLWVGMVVSATILVSSVGFVLSTTWPSLSMLIKTGIMVAWLMGAVMIPLTVSDSPPAWYVDWDPTSAFTARGLLSAYAIPLRSTMTNEAQAQQLVLYLENKMLDLAGWFAPHLVLAGLSLVLVLIAALTFKRSRKALTKDS